MSPRVYRAITYHVIGVEDVGYAMSSGKNVSVANNGTSAKVFAVSLKRCLIFKLTERGYVTADDTLGLIAVSLCTIETTKSLFVSKFTK